MCKYCNWYINMYSTVLGGLTNNKGLKILNLKLDPKGKDLSWSLNFDFHTLRSNSSIWDLLLSDVTCTTSIWNQYLQEDTKIDNWNRNRCKNDYKKCTLKMQWKWKCIIILVVSVIPYIKIVKIENIFWIKLSAL